MIQKTKKIEDILFMKFIENNDEHSFKELFKLVDPWLFKMVFRIVGDRSAAQDIVQQTWLVVIENKHKYDNSKGTITGYIHTIAKHNSLKWLRMKSSEVDIEMMEILDRNSSDLERDAIELKNIIQNSLRKLSNKNYIDALLLFYFAELKISEIKLLLNTSEENVKIWLHRGRIALEKEIKKYVSRETIIEFLSDKGKEKSN